MLRKPFPWRKLTPTQIDLLERLSMAGGVLLYNELPADMIDVCRRMHLRGWVERYESWSGAYWSRLTPAGREVLAAIGAMDAAMEEMADARSRVRLH